LHHLGRIRFLRGDLQSATNYLDASLNMARQCGRADIIAHSCLLHAHINTQQDHSVAITRAREAAQMFRRLGMRNQQAEAESLLRQLGESA
jgi:hypothetical protein